MAELARNLPGWAAASLVSAPWVVMRRALPFDGLLPVGIRGHGRSERCAAWLPPGAIAECRTPEDLAAARIWREHPRRVEVPALAALDTIAALLAACSLAEIAAGGPVVVKTPTGPRLVRDPWAEPAA